MTKREMVRMADSEITAFLAAGSRAYVSTLNRDGSPHVVPISYVLLDGELTFWGDTASQKLVNLQRDARIGAVVDAGVDFQELQGVVLEGVAELRTDAETNGRIADEFARKAPEEHRDAAKQMLLSLAAERTAVTIHAAKVASWDHRKLGGGARAQDLGR
jgi:nitroimidazol reductase NimA-like FMN-containing flavoprotein (pyridoxamine 5'-phosphate oxidase superfamily)